MLKENTLVILELLYANITTFNRSLVGMYLRVQKLSFMSANVALKSDKPRSYAHWAF